MAQANGTGAANGSLDRVVNHPLVTALTRFVIGVLAYLAIELRTEVRDVHRDQEALAQAVAVISERIEQRAAHAQSRDGEQNRRIEALEEWRLNRMAAGAK